MADVITRFRVDSTEYESKVKRASQGILQFGKSLQETGKSFTTADKNAVNFARDLGKMDTASNTAKGKVNELSTAFINLSTQYRRMTDEEKRSPFGRALAQSIEQLKQRTLEAKRELTSMNNEIGGSSLTGGSFGNILDTFGSKLGISGNLTEMLTSKTAMLTAGIGASVAIVGKATEAWVSYNTQLAKQDQITSVTTGLKGADSNRMTDAARALVDTYDVDFRSVIDAANTLMTQFGQTGEQATQLIREGLQGMIQGDGPKLLNMIQQYAPAFRDAGVSASQLVAVIHNSEGGIFTDQNMNAIVMGIKNIRLMTKSTSEALAKLGIDGEKMSKQLSDGTLTIFDALKQVATAIQGVDSNSQAAGEVMQQVFGRQGAMAGTKLGEAIATLNTNLEETRRQTGELGNAYDELYQANEKLNKAIRDCFEYDGWDQMAAGIRANLITALSSVVDWLARIKNGFTEAGRARNAYNSMGGDGQVNSQIDTLKNTNLKFYTYNDQVSQYNQRINALKAQIANGGKPVGGGSGSSQSIDYLNSQLAAVTRQRDEYRRQAAEVLRPRAATTPPSTTTPTYTPRSTRSGGGKVTPSVTPAKAEEIIPEGSVKALQKEMSELRQQQELVTDPEAWASYQKQIDEVADRINELKGNVKISPELEDQNKIEDLRTPFEKLQDSIRIEIAEKNIAVDQNALHSLMKVSIENSLQGLDLDFTNIQQQLAEGMDIPEEKWNELETEINEKLSKLGIDPINLDVDTGDIVKDAKEMGNAWQSAAGAVSSVGSVLQQIEDPAAKIMGIIAEAIANIALAFSKASVESASGGVWSWIAATASGLTTMVSTIAAIKSATSGSYAEGGVVAGTRFSGDNEIYALNAGEVILNRSQQANLASQLQGGGIDNLNLSASVNAEQIRFVLNNRGRRTGRGEYVQANFK